MTKPAASGDQSRFQLPGKAELDQMNLEQVEALKQSAETEFDGIYGQDGGPKADQFGRASELADAIEALAGRKTAIAQAEADNQAKFEALAARVRPPSTNPDGDDGGEEPPAEPTPETPAAPAQQPVPVGGAVAASRELGGLRGAAHNLNPSLAAVRGAGPAQAPTKQPLAITASVGLPGVFEAGERLADLRQLGDLAETRARRLGVSSGDRDRKVRFARDRSGRYLGTMVDAFGGTQIASIERDWADRLNEESPIEAVEAYRNKLNGKRRPAAFESLVAAGGWCAPGEPVWDFFDVSCVGGLIDLPTFGVNRGGVNIPTSPTVADAYTPDLGYFEAAFSNATVPWLWTEADDILTVTGSTNKPCLRVPCSAMVPYRLECYGICITQGNLADNAWPESTANFLRLIQNVHAMAANSRYISAIQTLAGATITQGVTCSGGGRGAAAPLLNLAEIAAVDYRARYGACPDDVVEMVLPTWAATAVRMDLAKRMGVSDFMCVTNAQIAAWFNCRNIRLQFVEQYQQRATGQPGAATPITTLPGNVDFMIWFPGAVARGNGMTLNLGVVRDSTLNAENDHTALWMEECHLIAQFGPAPRRYNVEICPDGTVGAADLTSSCP